MIVVHICYIIIILFLTKELLEKLNSITLATNFSIKLIIDVKSLKVVIYFETT